MSPHWRDPMVGRNVLSDPASAREYAVLAERERGMTVVAMALTWDSVARRTQGVAGVCDHLLSDDTSKVSLAYAKIADIAQSWIMGYAGTPALFLPMLRSIFHVQLSKDNADAVIESVKVAYRKIRLDEIEEKITKVYGLTLKDFLERGLAIFGEKRFGEICKQINTYDTGITLILGGWAENNPLDPRVVTISNPGTHYDHSLEGTAAIGMGAAIAQGHLDATFSSTSNTLMDASYRLLEAKFMAEAAPSVGRDTTLVSITPDSPDVSFLPKVKCDEFRGLWEARRNATLPELCEHLEMKTKPSMTGWRQGKII